MNQEEIFNQIKHINMNNTQHQNRPLYFSLEPEAQENEIFIDVAGAETYKVSNLGRVKNTKKSGDKILLSYRIDLSPNFYVKINAKQCRIKDLVYLSFFGEIPEDHDINFIDGDFTNLNVKNLIAKPKVRKPRGKYKVKQKVLKPKKLIKPNKIKVILNENNKAAQIERIKNLRKKGYILASFDNGIYKFRLNTKV